MALKFRLRGLAETFLEDIICGACGSRGTDDETFTTQHTRVTFDGIIVVVQCRKCSEIFVPIQQRLGVINPGALREAVSKDANETGEPVLVNFAAVRLNAERLNALRRGDVH